MSENRSALPPPFDSNGPQRGPMPSNGTNSSPGGRNGGLDDPLPSNPNSTRRGYGELSQSRAAVFAAVGLIFLNDIVNLWIMQSSAASTSSSSAFPNNSFMSIGPMIWDLFFGINLLRGKKWARDWTIVRAIVGLVVWGGISLVQGAPGDFIVNAGLVLALIILLTGTRAAIRIPSGVAMVLFTLVYGSYLQLTVPTHTLPSMPETAIPGNFLTYTDETLFSVSYPPDWVPLMSVVDTLQKSIQEEAQKLGQGSLVKGTQVVFVGGKTLANNDTVVVFVQLSPRNQYSLETVAEGTSQWAKGEVNGYVELSRVSTTIGGRDAVITIYQGYDNQSNLEKYTMAIVAGERFYWTVSAFCGVNSFDKYSNDFNDVVRSLRIKY